MTIIINWHVTTEGAIIEILTMLKKVYQLWVARHSYTQGWQILRHDLQATKLALSMSQYQAIYNSTKISMQYFIQSDDLKGNSYCVVLTFFVITSGNSEPVYNHRCPPTPHHCIARDFIVYLFGFPIPPPYIL